VLKEVQRTTVILYPSIVWVFQHPILKAPEYKWLKETPEKLAELKKAFRVCTGAAAPV